MGKIKTMFYLVFNNPTQIKEALLRNFSRSSFSHLIPDKKYIGFIYKNSIGKKLNLHDPQTFNEKLQWLKLYDRNPNYCGYVDKCEVKNYIANILGVEYVVPTIGVWDRFENIDFDKLPAQFVLKCTHDSGSTIICHDKKTFDFKSAKKKLTKKIRSNLFWHGREWPYKNVRPRIIAEQYMEDTKTSELRDYKFFCFNGEVKCFKVDFDRFVSHRANYYDTNGKLLRFGEKVCPPDFKREIEMPINLDLMLELAKKLSNGIPFVRVDFYEVNGKVYFGELTFYPASGFGPFIPEEWDFTLGSWISLPDKCK